MMNYKSRMVAYNFKRPIEAIYTTNYTDTLTDTLLDVLGFNNTVLAKREIIFQSYYNNWSYYKMFHNFVSLKSTLLGKKYQENINGLFDSIDSSLINDGDFTKGYFHEIFNNLINELFIHDKKYI